MERIDIIILGFAAAAGTGIIITFAILFLHPFSTSGTISTTVTCENNPAKVDHPFSNITVAISRSEALYDPSHIHFVEVNSSTLAKYPDLQNALTAEDKHFEEYLKICSTGVCNRGPPPPIEPSLFVNICAAVVEPLVKDPIFRFDNHNGPNGSVLPIFGTDIKVGDSRYGVVVYLGHG